MSNMTIDWKWSAFVPWNFVLGLAFGSFLNVCIYRLPRGMNVAKPRSACPNCKTPIAAYDNIPVLSWFILRGRCRSCRQPISARYWIIELLMGVLFALAMLICGPTTGTIKLCVLSFLLVGLIFTDADTKLLPDVLTLPGTVVGLLFSLLTFVDGFSYLLLQYVPDRLLAGHREMTISVADSILGILVGSGLLWGVSAFYKLVRGVDGMGFGDVKLMALIGAFLGPSFALATIMVGSIAGSFAGLILLLNVYRKRWLRRRRNEPAAEKRSRAWQSALLVYRHYEMPFGVFLGGAALVIAFLEGMLRYAVQWTY